MAEPLKRLLGPPVVREIARQLGRVGAVDEETFRAEALHGIEALQLMARSRHIAEVLTRHLPPGYRRALDLLRRALHPDTETPIDGQTLDGRGLRGWSLAPVGDYVARAGLDQPEASLGFLRELTQRFTAEFAVRPFLRDHPDIALAHAEAWARDPNPHVRRLASEATRPRLPWGLRLDRFIRDPGPLIPILTRLRDDPSAYVRRSVANSLNDIAKDHPGRVAALAADWLQDAPAPRRALVRQACRTLIKAGDPHTLAVFGFAPPDDVTATLSLSPPALSLGDTLTVALTLRSKSRQVLLIDLVLQFRKANGRLAPKVFKWTETQIEPGRPLRLTKRLPLRPVTTRRHYPGQQAVEVQVNGRTLARAAFELRVPDRSNAAS